MSNFIDLHTHTTFSDGTLTPTQLVELAKKKGLSAIAITDHDMADGIEEGFEAGRKIGVEVVPGIEVSTMYGQEVHILGLYIDYKSPDLVKIFKNLKEDRNRRNILLIKKLNNLGINITMDEVIEAARGSIVGRPHVAEVMLRKEYVSSFTEAFEKYLGSSGIAYTPRPEPLTPIDAVKLIKGVNGIPIMAHPGLLNKTQQETEKIILEFKEMGIEGIEVYHSDHNIEITKFLLAVAKKYNLLISGGSDFHGEHKDVIQLGSGREGNLHIEYSVLEKIKQKRKLKS